MTAIVVVNFTLIERHRDIAWNLIIRDFFFISNTENSKENEMCNGGPLGGLVDSFSKFQMLRNYNRLVTPTGLIALIHFTHSVIATRSSNQIQIYFFARRFGRPIL